MDQENLNPAFWEALEAYIRGRIIEQATTVELKECTECGEPCEDEVNGVCIDCATAYAYSNAY